MSFDLGKLIILIDYYTKVIRDLLNGLLANMGMGGLGEDTDAGTEE